MNVDRTERDSMGEVRLPQEALWGAQTQRAVENFPLSGYRFSRSFLRALGLVKYACAKVNTTLGLLPAHMGAALETAALAVAEGQHDEQFPVDVFQTGSGTSTNMNANEVIATLASRSLGETVHPNDHVNLCQSSNDVIPSVVHVSAALMLHEKLVPALHHLMEVLDHKAASLEGVVKTGRTHLMDALPLTFAQELSGWRAQFECAEQRLRDVQPRLQALAIGGTAVGTGVNAPLGFGEKVADVLSQVTNIPFKVTPNPFMSLSSQDTAVELSGHLKSLAVALMKIANDLRWMNSGPLAGLGEIHLPALQPGSSIMPGKVNPVIPEAVCMVAAQVMGADATITIAGQGGNFQLNVMLPVVAYNLLESLHLLSTSCCALADKALQGFEVRKDHVEEALSRNPILVTALNPVIGYEKGAVIAKKAYEEKRPVLDVARDVTGMDTEQLRSALDPLTLTKGGVLGS